MPRSSIASWMSLSLKALHGIAAAGQRFEQAFFLQRTSAVRTGVRDIAQALDHRQLGDALAGGQLAADDQLAQAQLRLASSATASARRGRRRRRRARSAIAAAAHAPAGRSGITGAILRLGGHQAVDQRRAHIEPASMFRL